MAGPKLSIGPVEAAFILGLQKIIDSVKIQLAANLQVLLKDHINAVTSKILSEEFNRLVQIISTIDSPSDFSFSGYTYPKFTTDYEIQKFTKYKYLTASPFREKRFRKNPRASMVGVMSALNQHQESGELLLKAFGEYSPETYTESEEDFTSLILDPAERKKYQALAKKQREALQHKRSPI